MSYVDFKASVKKVNLKPNGVKEIVLEVRNKDLDNQLNKLSEMIDCKVDVNLESRVVNYIVTVNTQTNKPVQEYQVDERGIVKPITATVEQVEADLRLPPEKIKTKDEKVQADRETIDDFIMNGLSPNFDDLPYDFANIVKRKLEGESYSKLAGELDISSGKIVELVDEYRMRVAPLAIKWSEWKESTSDKKED